MIDPVTHALQMSIPLGVYSGRGGNFPVVINYSSKVWNMKFQSKMSRPPGRDEGPWDHFYRPHFGDNSTSGWTSTLDWVQFPRILGGELFDIQGRPVGEDPYEGRVNLYAAARIYLYFPDGSMHEMRRDDAIHQVAYKYCATQGVPLEECSQANIRTQYNPDLPGVYFSIDGSGMKYDTATKTLWMSDGGRYVFTDNTNGYDASTFYDTNGNVVSYDYAADRWTDTLGRVIQPPLPTRTQLAVGDSTYQLPSINSSVQSYVMRWRNLRDPNNGETVLSDPNEQLLPMDDLVSPGTCTFQTGLFQSHQPCHLLGSPENNYFVTGSGSPPFNPIVLAEIELPGGQKYQFRYNIYGEVDKIIYPTAAYERFEYGLKPPIGALNYTDDPHGSAIYAQGNRGVTKRWISENGQGSEEILWEYGNPSGTIGSYTKAPDGTRTESRWYQGIITADALGGTFGFDDPKAGKTYETRTYDGNDVLRRRTLTKWIVENSGVAPRGRNPRPEKEVSILFEPGSSSALAQMTETVYDYHADPAYFASLNPKQVRSYRYKILDLITAQTLNVDAISAMFDESDLAAISETDYLYDANYKARGIVGLATETRVLNPTNTSEILAKSNFAYDEAAYFDNNYTTTNWEDPNSNLRGNVTTTRTWNKDTNTWIESHAMFDNFGNVRKVWDTSGDPSRFIETEYDPIYKYAYPTKTKAPAPDPTGVNGTTEGSEISRTYDFNTGLLLSVTDANGQTATTEYDERLRVKKITPPLGGSVSEMFYNDTPGNIWVKSRQQIDESNWAESTTFYDNLGRVKKTRTKDMQGDVVSEVRYDSFGRVAKTSNPYRVDVGGNSTETVYWSKLRYDNQSRVVETYAPAPEGQTGQSLGTVQFGISTLQNLVGTYVVATDASGRKSRAISGVYGLMRVDEATGKGGTADQDLGTLANPTQPTFYNYNIKGEMTKLTQGGQNRYFMYDSLGRLIRVRQPEQTPNPSIATTGNPDNNQWTAAYSYDVFGNVIGMTDAKNTTITNFYDKAGRTVKRTYSEGTPQVEYFYDGKGLPSTPQFSKGALTKVISSVSEDRFTSFDNHGRLLASQQITDGQTYNFGYQYNLSGGLVEQTYPSGRIIRNFLDSDGGLSAVTSKPGNGLTKRVASDFDYSPTGAVKKMKLGNGLWETAVFDELNQLKQTGLGTTQTNKNLFKIDYEYGELNDERTEVDATKNIGMIARTTTTIPTTSFVQTFKYDSINRLKEARETTGGQQNWIQTFGYDRFGNRTQFSQAIHGAELPTNNITKPTINQSDNRFTTGQGYVYDLNGNLIQDAEGRSFTFNGDDKQAEVRNTSTNQVIGQYSYDGSGARVKKFVPSTGETTVFVYDAGGALAAEYSTVVASVQEAKTSYLTTDHLGSPRVITDASGAVTARRDFMPFGEELGIGVGGRTEALKYANTSTDRVRKRFTGYEKDDETGLDFAEARMYQNRHGRFTAVDPLLASASALNPQTFNRYIYTGNNPVNITDPSGLDWCGQGGNQPGGFAEIKWVAGACGKDWKTIENGATVGCKASTCDVNGRTYLGGENFRLLDGGASQLVSPSAVAQGQNAAAASGSMASATATEAAASGTASGGGTEAGVTPLPTAGTGPTILPLCIDACNASSPPVGGGRITPFDGPSLKSVEAIARVTEACSMIPGLGAPCGIIAAATRFGQGRFGEAGENLLNAVPFFGWARKADKAADTAKVADDVVEGIYEFVSSNGKVYVGQSSNIPARITRHLASGKMLPDTPYKATEVLGGKTTREIAEQLRINALGGIRNKDATKNLRNKRNPIGKARKYLLEGL